MAYAKNILPRSAAYYSLNRADIISSDLVLEAGGYAEINISTQMLPKLTESMLVVLHTSVHSSYYTNDAVQVEISLITSEGIKNEYLISASNSPSGVFNTVITLPDDEDYVMLKYRISSSKPAVVYNWELCPLAVADLTTKIDGVEQAVPRLLYDYNTYAYAVAQKQYTVGLITCFLQQATDLQGHFTLSFFATERCNVHVRIKDNGVTELYTPQVYTVDKGYSSISIPHAYLAKVSGIHSFSVSVQCTNGQLSIPVRGLLYTIDGGYLATRLLDAGQDIQDIALKQLRTDAVPSEIYSIGFEGDRLILKKRPYEYAQYNWEAEYDFGSNIGAAVEFYGRWLNRNNSDKYTIETNEHPVVFIIGHDKVLNAYMEADYTTPIFVDSNVSKVAACQGFNSMYDIDQDQGLVVAYIKNGNVYYRQYAYSEDGYYWLGINLLYEGGDASFVSIHRLPDYRLGICVTYSTGTKWYITDRTYVSQSVKTEVIGTELDDIPYIAVIDNDQLNNATGTATQNTFEEGSLFNNFTMTFEGPLVFKKGRTIATLRDSLKVYINNALYTGLVTISIASTILTVILADDVIGGKTVRIECNCDYLGVQLYNGCIIKASQSYSWSLPLPTTRFGAHDAARVSVDTTNTIQVRPIVSSTLNTEDVIPVGVQPYYTIGVNEIITHSVPYVDNLVASVSNTVSIEVQQVGTSPV